MSEKTTARECAFGDLSDAATKAALLRDSLRRNREAAGRQVAPASDGRGAER